MFSNAWKIKEVIVKNKCEISLDVQEENKQAT